MKMYALASSRRPNYSRASDASKQSTSVETPLEPTLRRAATFINHGDCSAGRKVLRGIIAENVDNPEIYNLFGISYERDGDRFKASKFYRVAYYMDPTFQSASDNLSRVCGCDYCEDINLISWGVDFLEVDK